jgi:hypothetical protein
MYQDSELIDGQFYTILHTAEKKKFNIVKYCKQHNIFMGQAVA